MSICTNCNGKGYNTVYKGEGGYTDFGSMKYIETTPMGIQKVPCSKCKAKEETTELEKQTTGQTVYEQLQEIADAFAEYKGYAWINIEEDRIELKPTGGYEMITMSYHDLFSKDSGIMEYVEWKKEEDSFLIISGQGRDRDIWYHNSEYQYMIMGPMTTEQKIQYFIDNTIISTK